jgi:hypothetical protein
MGGMAAYPFLYRCSTTGQNVQGLAQYTPNADASAYQTVTCLACSRVHLVNPSTGSVIGDTGTRDATR